MLKETARWKATSVISIMGSDWSLGMEVIAEEVV